MHIFRDVLSAVEFAVLEEMYQHLKEQTVAHIDLIGTSVVLSCLSVLAINL